MKKLLLISTVLLAACSSKNDVAMNEAYQKYNAQAEQNRMNTIATIAAQGDNGVLAAAMLMQGGNASGAITAQPTSSGDKVLNTVAALSPTIIGLGQIAATVDGNRTNKEIAVVQSDNSAKVAIDTNDTMSELATVSIVTPEFQVVEPKVYCVFDGTSACQ
jgi:outer membrane biogenesis lipoprotein LolB